MDETQRRKLSAKEFIQRNKNIGFGIIGIFVFLFIMYFVFIYFYSQSNQNNFDEVGNGQINLNGDSGDSTFLGTLLPTFEIKEDKTSSELDSDFLKNFNSSNPDANLLGDSVEGTDNSKIIKIEDKPVVGYTVFDKPISIKRYIKIKPKICSEKLEEETKKEEKSTAVLNFQNTLKSIDEYSNTPVTGILDQETREYIYIFQKRYAEILYKKKADKTPSRVMDPQTIHFLNLLCGFDQENADDFINVPTLRYVLKETRGIYDFNTGNKEKTEIASKLATGTEDVVFSKNGEYAVFRRDINGTIGSIYYNIRTKAVTHLENNITTLDFNDKNILYYGVPGFLGMTIKSYDHLNNKAIRVAVLPLNDWDIKVFSTFEIGISSKPSAFAEGVFMILNTQTKKLRQLAGPLLGMSIQKTNIPEFTILSTGGLGEIKTLLLNNKTRKLGDFGIKTFAEKCSQTIFAEGIFCAVPKTLSLNFIYPDDWYKGKIQTEDAIVFKTLSGTSTTVISNLENRPISIINLNVNKNGIFFIDEKTFSLYSLEL